MRNLNILSSKQPTVSSKFFRKSNSLRCKISIWLIIAVTWYPAFGQQLAQYSQYLHNPIILNPATTGVDNNLNLDISYRNQWTGFNDAPKTYYITLQGTLFREKRNTSLRMSRPGYTTVKKTGRNINHGVGGYVISDKYGAFSNTSGYLTYALHIKLSNSFKLSLGLAGGVSNWRLNKEEVGISDPNDATYNYLMSHNLSKTFFDLNGGLWVYSSAFYVGYSAAQMMQNQIRSIDIPAEAKVNVHHFATAGYRFVINENLDITPSTMIKYMWPAPVSFDFNIKANYQNKFWGGLSYRKSDAVIVMLGYNIKNMIHIGYSYDLTLSELRSYSSGSHEIVVGVRFFKDNQRSSISFL